MSDEFEMQVEQEITSDLILNLYENAKKLKGEEYDAQMAVIKTLSDHIGDWLVLEDQQDTS